MYQKAAKENGGMEECGCRQFCHNKRCIQGFSRILHAERAHAHDKHFLALHVHLIWSPTDAVDYWPLKSILLWQRDTSGLLQAAWAHDRVVDDDLLLAAALCTLAGLANRVFDPNIGAGSSVPGMAMQIIELMMLGDCSSGVTHLYRIITSMKPKKLSMNKVMGAHSKTRSTRLPSQSALKHLSESPASMWTTPINTESFIFNEFMKVSWFFAPFQAQSTPNG